MSFEPYGPFSLNYDPNYAIRVASDRLEDIEREIAAVKDKINSIPAIVQQQTDISHLRKEKRQLLKSKSEDAVDKVMKIESLMKQMHKSIKDDEDARPLRRELKTLLCRRKYDKITIEGHDEFLKYWKEVKNRVAERQRQRDAELRSPRENEKMSILKQWVAIKLIWL